VPEIIMCKPASLPLLVWMVLAGLALTAAEANAGSSCPDVGFTVVEPQAGAQTRPVRMGRHEILHVWRVSLTTTSDIIEIKLEGHDDDANILLKFTPLAIGRLMEATTNHSGRRLAFMVDDEVLLKVVWQGP
jgi:hypothetical protein